MKKSRLSPVRVSVLAGVTVLLSCFSSTAQQWWPHGRISEVTLERKEQVKKGFIYWSGPRDASLKLTFQVQESDVLIHGIWVDDDPLLQLWPGDIQSKDSKMEYGADGIRIGRIALVEGAARLVSDFLVELAPYGVESRITLLNTDKPGVNESLNYWSKVNIRHHRVEFQFKIKLEDLLIEPSNLEKGVWVVRLYDLDGDGRDYTVLEDRAVGVEKERSPVKAPSAAPESEENQSVNGGPEGNQ
jgi:hypothetical protein